ncbi:MAG: TolC family protein [Elusimicrobiota bacterium]|nr:TolC family protein [Elusimicrobiota bacterium]
MNSGRIIVSLAFLALPAAAQTLPLDAFLRQVEEKHGGVRAAAEAETGSRARAAEGELPLSPLMFFEGERSLDASPKNFPAAEGERVERSSARAGISRKTTLGLSAKVFYAFSRNDLNGADPNFVRPPSYYFASPGGELSLDLWRNLFGRETRARVDATRQRALGRSRQSRLERRRLLAEAEAAYWTLSAARRKEGIAAESLERAETLRDWVADRVNRRLADRSEGLEAEAVVRLRALELRAAADERRTAERAFAAQLGGGDAAGELAALDDDGSVPRRAAVPDDVATAGHDEAASAAEARLGVEGTRPAVELYAAGSLNGRRGASSQAVNDSFSPDGPRYAVGLRATYSLDPALVRGVRDGYRQEAKSAASRRGRAELDAAERWKDLEAGLGDARERVKLARAIEETQKERAEAERRRREEGRTTTFFVLQAEQDWASARRARVEAELGVRLTLARMKPFTEE